MESHFGPITCRERLFCQTNKSVNDCQSTGSVRRPM
jgi:hypothetical protein